MRLYVSTVMMSAGLKTQIKHFLSQNGPNLISPIQTSVWPLFIKTRKSLTKEAIQIGYPNEKIKVRAFLKT